MERATFAGFDHNVLMKMLAAGNCVDIFDLRREKPVKLVKMNNEVLVYADSVIVQKLSFNGESVQQFLKVVGSKPVAEVVGRVLVVVSGGCAYPVATSGIEMFVADLDNVRQGEEPEAVPREWSGLIKTAGINWPVLDDDGSGCEGESSDCCKKDVAEQMSQDIYVMVCERDSGNPADPQNKPIVFEQPALNASYEQIKAKAHSFGKTFGKIRIAKLQFIDD